MDLIGIQRLQGITSFTKLVDYLRDELDWPVDESKFDELTFEYQPQELGLRESDAVKVRDIRQLRPLQEGQPWGIFFVEFSNQHLPIVVMRRILSHLVTRRRSASPEMVTWQPDNLLFVTSFGAISEREIAFAHFHQESGALPTMQILGWDGADTALKIDHVALTLKDKLRWPQDPKDIGKWREQWSGAFRHEIGHVIKTADALAERLAELARNIRDAAQILIEHESEDGHLRKLHKAFQTALIHDLTESDFADTYAQTITYGLLTAAISRTDMSDGQYGTALVAENVTDMVPITNPFLREMLETFLRAGGGKEGMDFDELGIQDVVELLRGQETDLPAVLRDFGNRTQGEDPVIHFYEHFLNAYNKKLKVQRGVFYTPKPVVSYIVRSVHELLQTEFGLEDGLADTTTWREMENRIVGFTRPQTAPPDSPFVTVLDPATGTATFLVEVIDVIHQTLTAKWEQQRLSKIAQQTAWNEYVPKHLLPRLHGYELMMAPYAIAHMKIGLKLGETGYRFNSDERAHIYLTNTLEPTSGGEEQLSFDFDAPALAHESQAVNAVKRKQLFTIIMGNPPYSDSTTENEWIMNLIRVFKENLGEQKADLNREEWKFLRFAYEATSNSPARVIGFVINNAFLKAITHRKMRQFIHSTNDRLYVGNLHGSSKPPEFVPESAQLELGIGKQDTNVFDIQQGVTIFISKKSPHSEQSVGYFDLWGERERKYKYLEGNSLKTSKWQTISPQADQYFFIPRNNENEDEYMSYSSIVDIFRSYVSGIQTGRDDFVSTLTEEEMASRLHAISKFGDWPQIAPGTVEPIWEGFSLSELRKAIEAGEKHLSQWLSRPFDIRPIIYHSSVIKRMRGNTMLSMQHNNLGLCLVRQLSMPTWQHALVVNRIISDTAISANSREYNYIFPSYLHDSSNQTALISDLPGSLNLSTSFTKVMKKKLAKNGSLGSDVPNNISANDILGYLYAILYSPSYRKRFSEFLKIDFPRLPLTASVELFRQLCGLGGQLVALHLLESPVLEQPITNFTGEGDNVVAKGYPKYLDGVMLVNPIQGFEGVPEDVWKFHIGGYQVCEKWLKDRRGRELSAEDIVHYQKVVVALKETLRLMAEIDAAIDAHGGWPIK